MNKPYFSTIVSLAKKLLNRGDRVVDIGANAGQETIPLAEFVGGGIVYAFEPVPQFFHALQNQISNLNLKNVKIFNKAVWNKETTIQITIPENSGWPTIIQDLVEKHPEIYESKLEYASIETVTLDNFFKDQNVDLIKCDAQGADVDIIYGGEKLIKRCKPHMIFEYPKEVLTKEINDSLYQFLTSLGYKVYMHYQGEDNMIPEEILSRIENADHLWTIQGWDVFCVNPEKYPHEIKNQ